MENVAVKRTSKHRESSSSPCRPNGVSNGDNERHHPSVPRVITSLSGSNSPRIRKAGGHRGRKLVLHFDIRNTILVADSIDNISVEQALNSFLTGVTWGKETPGHEDGWEWYSDCPSLTAPEANTMTYYKHLEARIVRIPSDRVTLRRVTGDFTQRDIGRKFVSYFNKHLKLLEWPHCQSRPSERLLAMKGKDGKLYHYILPALYRLIHHLHANGREFSIVLRTYGLDAHNVCKSIKKTLDGKHPQFPEPLPISVNTCCGKISRRDGSIALHVPAEDCEDGTGAVLKDERTIYNYLSETTGVSAFVDDFRYWQDNSYNHACAKPLWLEPSQQHVHHVFFDDNIRVSDTDSIVDVRVFDSPSSRKARSLSQEDAAKFDQTCLIQANLLESTSNPDYFIDKLAICERHYDAFLQSASANR